MLTVKVVESPHDIEVVFEAKQVRKTLFPDRKDGDRFIGEVRLDPADGEGQIVYGIRASSSEDIAQTMYVMNRFGATVAVYHL